MTSRRAFLYSVPLLILLLMVAGLPAAPLQALQSEELCEAAFVSVSRPLNDLGSDEYVRLEDGPTGFNGGLYPGGSNARPAAHEASGVELAGAITPLDAAGNPDPAGTIVMISVGMSNTGMEFAEFIRWAEDDPDVNAELLIVSGAQAGAVSDEWTDPDAPTWDVVDDRLAHHGVTPEQVQVAWVKQTRTGSGDFPEMAQTVQDDLATIARNLLIRYPNVKLAYYSSRTRSYTYWTGLSPEPAAFENGFSVKWMIEAQIEGDPELNFDPEAGPIVAPYLSWGPYLWIDGENVRSDGRVWPASDLIADCTHPSESGVDKVAEQLLDYFKTDTTTAPWFLEDEVTPEPTPTPTPTPSPPDEFIFLPVVHFSSGQANGVEGAVKGDVGKLVRAEEAGRVGVVAGL